MRIIIHADPGAEGMAVAERVKRKIESRVAQADGIVEIVQAETDAPAGGFAEIRNYAPGFRGDPE